MSAFDPEAGTDPTEIMIDILNRKKLYTIGGSVFTDKELETLENAIEQGADVNKKLDIDKGHGIYSGSPLDLAIYSGNVYVVDLLLNHGAINSEKFTEERGIGLTLLAGFQNIELIEYLLKRINHIPEHELDNAAKRLRMFDDPRYDRLILKIENYKGNDAYRQSEWSKYYPEKSDSYFYLARQKARQKSPVILEEEVVPKEVVTEEVVSEQEIINENQKKTDPTTIMIDILKSKPRYTRQPDGLPDPSYSKEKLEILRKAIEEGANVNEEIDIEGDAKIHLEINVGFPLDLAFYIGNKYIVKLLLDNGAIHSNNFTRNWGSVGLYYLSNDTNVELMRYILSRNRRSSIPDNEYNRAIESINWSYDQIRNRPDISDDEPKEYVRKETPKPKFSMNKYLPRLPSLPSFLKKKTDTTKKPTPKKGGKTKKRSNKSNKNTKRRK